MSDYKLARVKERSVGSLFFSIFGGLWLFVSLLAFGLLTPRVALLLGAIMLAFIMAAVWLLQSVPRGVKPDPKRERDGRMFGWVNAVQGLAIFVVFQLAYRFHHGDVAFPVAVLIVGLHIFALPRSYWIVSNLVTGAILVVAATLCLVLFRGDTMVGAVTMCAGVTLWCSAVWKLRTAILLLRASEPRFVGAVLNANPTPISMESTQSSISPEKCLCVLQQPEADALCILSFCPLLF